jgi:hypothetical protein
VIVQVVLTLESGCEAGGYKRAWKNGLAGRYQGEWRARGLGSIRWHEANANLMKKHKVKLIVES